MKGLFDKSTISSSHLLSKSDKKKYNIISGNALDIKQEYTIINMSNKIKVIQNSEGECILFSHYNKLYPTVKHFNRKVHSVVFLDEGARKPIINGADVMIPGVLKYKDEADHFDADAVVGIAIKTGNRSDNDERSTSIAESQRDLGFEILAVGKALMSYKEMLGHTSGPIIDILHVSGDILDRGRLI